MVGQEHSMPTANMNRNVSAGSATRRPALEIVRDGVVISPFLGKDVCGDVGGDVGEEGSCVSTAA